MNIPEEVEKIIEKLQEKGFEAYAVGGCVRDLVLSEVEGFLLKPKDWDVTTNASPEQIQEIFPESFYENKFGTVTVKTDSDDGTLREIEVTTYRVDAAYSDKRHPDSISFTGNLKEDLARRDFTINALALKFPISNFPFGPSSRRGQFPNKSQDSNSKFQTNTEYKIQDTDFFIIDPFGGQKDLKEHLIRAVGDPKERFDEDALRMMRAVRLAVEMGFGIEEKTKVAIKKNAGWLQAIAKERIRDEFEKIIMSEHPDKGVELLHELDLLEYIIPELEKGVGVSQNRHHIYTIFEHAIFSLKFAAHPSNFSKSKIVRAKKKYNLVVRLAALLHDVAKPQAKRGEGADSTFYNHDIMGARAAVKILERLKFPREIIERVANLIRNHMFVYDIGAVTEAGVRRLLVRVGKENMEDLIAVRVADRLGSGVPKAQPYRLRHFQYMVEKVQLDPISAKMLKVDGNDIMEILEMEPGPKIGAILDVLLAEVIEKPELNTKEYLSQRVTELNEIDLLQLRAMAKEKIEEKKEEEDKIIKNKYWVE
jgi:tRNA nucleotidyltransferase (CCA-adding enzyme)